MLMSEFSLEAHKQPSLSMPHENGRPNGNHTVIANTVVVLLILEPVGFT